MKTTIAFFLALALSSTALALDSMELWVEVRTEVADACFSRWLEIADNPVLGKEYRRIYKQSHRARLTDQYVNAILQRYPGFARYQRKDREKTYEQLSRACFHELLRRS